MSKEYLKKGNPKTQFTSENQPSNEAKKEGRRKSLLLKDIARQMVSGDSKEALKDLALYLGVEIERIDLETAMHLRQMEKAVKEGDTRAYNAVMDRIKGKPIQAIDLTSDSESIAPISREERDNFLKEIKKAANIGVE